jgi:hypothetical protein
MPATHRLICLFLCFLARTVFAGQEASTASCITHNLTTEKVKARLFVRSLAAVAIWGIDAIEISPCLSDEGVATQVILSLPKGWSSLGVQYRMRLSLWLDPETSMPNENKKNIINQNVATIIKKLLSVIERGETVRSFIERYQPVEAWITPDNGTDKLGFDFQSINANDANSPKLLLQANVPGFVAGYRLPRIDGLPVRRELLRFAELVSMQQPGCSISDIKAQRQENPVDDKQKRTLWSIDARLHGKGCQKAIALTIDENGNEAPEPEN